MKEILKQHIIKRLGKEPDDLERVLEHFEVLTVKRGEHLLQQGELCRYVYFIVDGCIQVYVIDKNGNESIRDFYLEDYWVSDIFAFQNQSPASENIKCIEPCNLLRIHFDNFQRLAAQLPPFAGIYKRLLETSYNNTVYRLNTLNSMDALDRIKWLMEYKPALMTRISSKLIASYLGISPETMTRLKGKL